MRKTETYRQRVEKEKRKKRRGGGGGDHTCRGRGESPNSIFRVKIFFEYVCELAPVLLGGKHFFESLRPASSQKSRAALSQNYLY